MIKIGDNIKFVQHISVDGFSTMAISIKGSILDIDLSRGQRIYKVKVDQSHINSILKKIKKFNKNSFFIEKSPWVESNGVKNSKDIICVFHKDIRKDSKSGNKSMNLLISDINQDALRKVNVVIDTINAIDFDYKNW